MKKRFYTEFSENDNMIISWFFKLIALHIFYEGRGDSANEWKIFVTFRVFGIELFQFQYRDEHKRCVYVPTIVWNGLLPSLALETCDPKLI